MKKCLFVLALISTVLFASAAFAKSVDLVNLEPVTGHPFEMVVTPDEAYRGYHRTSGEYHFLIDAGSTLTVVIRPKEYNITITRVEMTGYNAVNGAVKGDSSNPQYGDFAYIEVPYGGNSARMVITPRRNGFAPYKMNIAFRANDVTGYFGAWLHTSTATLPDDNDLVSPASGCNTGFGIGALLPAFVLWALRKK